MTDAFGRVLAAASGRAPRTGVMRGSEKEELISIDGGVALHTDTRRASGLRRVRRCDVIGSVNRLVWRQICGKG